MLKKDMDNSVIAAPYNIYVCMFVCYLGGVLFGRKTLSIWQSRRSESIASHGESLENAWFRCLVDFIFVCVILFLGKGVR